MRIVVEQKLEAAESRTQVEVRARIVAESKLELVEKRWAIVSPDFLIFLISFTQN